MGKEKCPICTNLDCDEFIIDLLICNNCSHVFKKQDELQEPGLTNPLWALHLYKDPVDVVRVGVDKFEKGAVIELNFPSMNFYTLDLRPTNFYRSSINHYFNQMSLMILLERCRLKPIKQQNNWNEDEKICMTKIICRRI